MKRWEAALAAAGALLLGVSAWAIRGKELPRHDFVITGAGCHVPATVIVPPGKIQGSAIVFHGLTANRRIMLRLASDVASEAGLRVYLVDLPGHGDNTDSFSFPRAEECATVAVESLIRGGKVEPSKTVVIGHSMGGAVAIRMADRDPVAATIAISPAPMTLPRRMPANLLVFSAQFDIGILKREAGALFQAAGGERTGADDFSQQRAFHLQRTPLSAHTSLIFDPRVLEQSRDWIEDALVPGWGKAFGVTEWNAHVGWDLHPPETRSRRDRLLLLATSVQPIAPALGVVGLFLLFPVGSSLAAKIAGAPQPESAAARPTRALALAEGAACAIVTVLILKLGLPLRFFHIYSGDYLASALLIAGALLLGLNGKAARENWSPRGSMLLAAALVGLVTVLGIGAWLNWQLTDMWMTAPRWLRFAALVPVAFIYGYAEEIVLGPVGQGGQRALRFAVFLALRIELWLACLLAYCTLASGQVLILIMATFLAAFSLLQRLAADALLRRTGSAMAAALFGAILAAWFIAAVFPTT